MKSSYIIFPIKFHIYRNLFKFFSLIFYKFGEQINSNFMMYKKSRIMTNGFTLLSGQVATIRKSDDHSVGVLDGL